jgi:hypothetical protein
VPDDDEFDPSRKLIANEIIASRIEKRMLMAFAVSGISCWIIYGRYFV